jgi:hypothetical protein
MAQFVAFDKKVMVNGQTILSVIKGMKGFEASATKILAEKGINDPAPNQWYPQQAWLDAFKVIVEKIGPKTLNSIGQMIPENADWPPQVNSIETALASIDIAYHMNHSLAGKPLFDPASGRMSEGIGHYSFKKISANEVQVICKNPYPCEFDKGLIRAAASKFKPGGAKLEFLEHTSSGCRNTGGEHCTYIVKW